MNNKKRHQQARIFQIKTEDLDSINLDYNLNSNSKKKKKKKNKKTQTHVVKLNMTIKILLQIVYFVYQIKINLDK